MNSGIDNSGKVDALALSRSRVRLEPAGPWVVPCLYSSDLKPKSIGGAAHLLFDRQVRAEAHKTYVHVAFRLETLQAVQNYSQWRLEFEPVTQSIAIHSIRVRRGDNEVEFAQLDRMRFLQREARLEGLVIDGGVTLLLLLEDVRPGDILEWSYTIENEPRLHSRYHSGFFPCGQGVHIGKYHLSVRFDESQLLKWKSSSPDLSPVVNQENGEINWVWMRDNFTSPEPEERTPEWCLSYPWIQISDWPDWTSVSAAFSKAWEKGPAESEFEALIKEITVVGPEIERQVNRAIQIVQDDIRYLSVNLELGGQIPADAASVIRRRYGDCKDLAFLLVELLKRLGIPARPVLVNTVLRKSLRDLLPSPNLFNHAIVEYQLKNETRWVDATLKRQGGGALDRVVQDFSWGLPLDEKGSELAAPPADLSQASSYEVKEHFLLDTTGDWSYLARIITAKGLYAENLRLEFEREGLEAIEKKRLEHRVQRFSQARRVGALQYRDDREINQFVISEVYEINGFLRTTENSGQCYFFINNNEYAQVIPLPSKAERRTPYGLAHPCRLIHTVEIESLGIGLAALPAFRLKDEFFEFTCVSRGVRKFTTMTFSMTTLADSVPPGRLAEYRKSVERAIPLSSARLRLPVGHSRMRKRSDFGALPAAGNPAAKSPAPARPEAARPVVLGSPTPKVAVVNTLPNRNFEAIRNQEMASIVLRDSDEVEASRRAARHSRRKSRGAASPGQRRREVVWIIGVAIAIGLIIAYAYFFAPR